MNTRQRAVTAIALVLAVMAIAGSLRAADHTKILGYKFGSSRAALSAIEAEIRSWLTGGSDRG